MKTKDDISKIKAVVLYILNQCGEAQEMFDLCMKLYLCQQKYLALYGRYLVNEDFHVNFYGLTALFTSKAILGEYKGKVSFGESFSIERKRGGIYVSSKEQPDMEELAIAEVEVIDDVLPQLKGKSNVEFSFMCRQDSVWREASSRFEDDPTDSRISPVKMARAGGASEETIKYLRLYLRTLKYWSSQA